MMKRFFLLLLGLLMLAAPARASRNEAWSPLVWSFDPAPYAPDPAGYAPDNGGYHDASIDVRIETFRWEQSKIWAVRVNLTDPSQLRTGLAGRYPGKKTQRVGDMATRFNAVLAINGDYFSYHETGIVVRNGKTLRFKPNRSRDTLVIDDKGDFTILSPTTREGFESLDSPVMHAFCFGPGLVVNGQALTSLEHADVGNAPAKATQRIAIGQTGPLEYLIIATEGPDNKGSEGFTILQMAELCQEMGCINAYNLDGGSSSSVVLGGKKINALSTGKIRPVGDCIYFATLIP